MPIFLKASMANGPVKSCTMITSTFASTISPGYTTFFPEALAKIFSVMFIFSLIPKLT